MSPWALTFEGYNAGVTTFRYATDGFVTSATDTPANTHFGERLAKAGVFARHMFAEGRTRGRSRTDSGDASLANNDGGLDTLKNYGIDGRPFTAYYREDGTAFPSGAYVMATGTLGQPDIGIDRVVLRLLGRQDELDVPLQPIKYDGSGGLEGGDALKGKRKPLAFGKARNVPAVLVDPVRLIYQVHSAAATISDVRDRGMTLKTTTAAWTSRTSGVATNLEGARYGNGVFVAVGKGGVIRRSTNEGVTWASAATPSFGATDAYSSAYSPTLSLWVAVGGAGKIATSTDGDTWTQRTSPFAAVVVHDVTWGGGRFVAVAADGTIARSTNGTAWTLAATPSFGGTAIYGVGYGNALYVACGDDAKIATSTDGDTWTQRPSGLPTTKFLSAVAFGRGLFIVAGSEILSSPQGMAWTKRTDLAAVDGGAWAYDVTFSETLGRFVAVGASLSAVSFDGTLWSVDPDNFDPDAALGVAAGSYSVVAVGEAGKVYTGNQSATYASTTDLQDDTLAPTPGTYKTFAGTAGTFVRLGSSPIGLVTCDVVQGSTAADRTTGQAFVFVLTQAGLTSSDWSAADVTAIDTDQSAEIGFWEGSDSQVTCAATMDQLADGVGAGVWVDRTGDFRIAILEDPSASSSLHTFTEDDMVVGSLERIATRDEGEGIPVWRVTVQYSRNHAPQPTDLAFGVSEANREAFGREFYEEIDEDATVQTKHLLAREIVKECLFSDQADASAEAARELTLRSADRDMYQFSAPITAERIDDLDINAVVTVKHSRFGLSAGKKFVVLGIDPDADKMLARYTVWG